MRAFSPFYRACLFGLLALALLWPISKPFAQTSPPAAEKQRVVTVVVARNWPPHMVVDKRGKATGFAIEIFEAVAARAGLKYRYLVAATAAETVPALKQGRAQIMPTMGIIPSRRAFADFTSPVETFVVSLFVRKETHDVSGLERDHNHKVGVVEANIGIRLVKGFPNWTPDIFKSVEEAVFALVAGRIDGLIYPRPIVERIAAEIGLDNKIVALGKPLAEVKRGIAVAKGNPGLLRRLDAAVNEFVGTREYQDIVLKWFGRPTPFWTGTRVAVTVIAALLIALLLAAVWRHFSILLLNRRLQESEARFRGTFDQAAVGVCQVAADGTFLRVNSEFCKITGYAADEILALTFQDITHPDDREKHVESAAQMLSGEIPTYTLEKRYVRKDGSIIWGNVTVSMVFKPDGTPDYYVAVVEDISDRKRAEQDLRELNEELESRVAERTAELSEARDKYRHIFDNAQVGLARTRISDGKALEVNDLHVEMFGYENREDFLENFYAANHYAKQDERKNLIEACRREGYVENYVNVAIRKDGTKIWVRFSARAHFDKDYLEIAIIDITAQREAEEALRQSERRLRDFASTAADRFWETDENLIFTYVSPPTGRLSRRAAEFVGKHFWDVHKESGRWLAYIKLLEERKPFRDFRVTIKGQDGMPRHLRLSGAPVFGEAGAFLGYRGTTVDETSTIEAQKLAADIQKQFHDAIENLAAGFVLWSADDRLITCNSHYREIHAKFADILVPGVTYEEFTRALLKDSKIDATDKDRVVLLEKFVADHHLPHSESQIVLYGRWYLIRKQRLEDGSAVGYLTDITEEKKREAEFNQVQKMDSLGNLAGGMAHTLNNLLLPIMSLSQLLKNDFAKDGEQHEMIEKIILASNRAKELVARILTFSRTTEPNRQRVDAYDMVSESLALLRSTVPPTITLTEQLDKKTGDIMADPVQTETVLMNLVTNAAAAIKDKTGEIKVTLARTEVDGKLAKSVNGLKPGNYAMLSVADNGPGIDAAARDKIFDPFFTTKGVGEGTGLGLSMAHGIIQQHDGAIRVTSRKGGGTKFEVYLPIAEKRTLH